MSASDNKQVPALFVGKRISFIEALNPFDPTERVTHSVQWAPTKTVKDYVDDSGMLDKHREVVVSLNGRIVEQSDWALTYAGVDDFLVACPVPQGGGGGSNKMARLVVTIVAMVVSIYQPALGMAIMAVGNYLLMPKPPNTDGKDDPSFGIDGPKNSSAEGVPVPVVYGTHELGGNILALHTENDGDSQYLYMLLNAGEGPVASIDNIKINDQLAWQNGRSTGAFQNLEAQVRHGQAHQEPIEWFGDIVTPHYRGSRLNQEWLHHTTQEAVDKLRVDVVFPLGLQRIDKKGGRLSYTVPLQVNYRRRGTTEWFSFPLGEGAVAVAYDFYFKKYENHGGDQLAGAYGSGDYLDVMGSQVYIPPEPTEYRWREEYRYQDNGSYQWVVVSGTPPRGWKGSIVTHYEQTLTDPFSGTTSSTFGVENMFVGNGATHNALSVDIHGGSSAGVVGTVTSVAIYGDDGVFNITRKQTTPLRLSFSTTRLPRDVYEVRVRRLTADHNDQNIAEQVQVTDINEIKLDDMTYPHTALVGIKVRLSDQLSALPKVTYETSGVQIRTYYREPFTVQIPFLNTSFTFAAGWYLNPSHNPAFIALDMLTNPRYGGRFPDNRIDMEKWLEWADWCREQNLSYRGVFDQNSNLWDALQQVMRCGRAQLVMQGTRLTVAIEREGTPSMMFSVANILEGTFESSWLPLADRYNEIEVNFLDEKDGYKRRTVRVSDQHAADLDKPPRALTIDLPGVVSEERAYREARLMLNAARYITQSVKFDAPLEAIACSIGDLIYVQHDMPQWGYAGRLERDSTTSVLNLDRPVPMLPGRTHRVLVHYGALRRAAGTISAVNGTAITLPGYDGDKRIKRLKAAGLDVEVTGTFFDGTYHGVYVRSAAGLSANIGYELWDTDAIEERDVVNSLTEASELTKISLASPLPSAVFEHAQFMFGEVEKVKKPFRVNAIDAGSQDLTRTIRALEYNASVYNDKIDDVPTPNYSSLSSSIGQVRNLAAEDELIHIGTAVRTRLHVRWDKPIEGLYEGANLYMAEGDGSFAYVNTVKAGTTSYALEVEDGKTLRIKVVAVDAVGTAANPSTAPVIEHYVVGKLAPPADVLGFAARKAVGGIRLVWSANEDIDLAGYEIREGVSWDDGEILVQRYAGTSFLAERSKAGDYTFHIRAIDTSGNYSARPTTLLFAMIAPGFVRSFDCVQNGKLINFRWDANTEVDVVGYEIREGVSWGLGVRITQVDGTSYSMSSDLPGERTFWIKALDSAGLYSNDAVFATTAVARSDDRNLVFTSDQMAGGWGGIKLNTYVTADNYLNLGADHNYGEYIYPVGLPKTYRARSLINTAINAFAVSSTSWAEATLSWAEAGELHWAKPGDLNSVQVDHQFSIYKGLTTSDVEGFLFRDSLTGIKLTAAAEAIKPTYAQGRFDKGVRVKDITHISWTLALPETFKVSFWFIPDELADCLIWSATGTNGSLRVGYRLRDKSFYLEDDIGNIIALPLNLKVGQRVLIAVVVTRGERKFFVGGADRIEHRRSGALTMNPVTGGYSSVRLY